MSNRLSDKHAKLLRRLEAARDFPAHTDPCSRHVAIMAEHLLRQEPYPMLQEEPAHCGESLVYTVAMLWEARKELAALKRQADTPERRNTREHVSGSDCWCMPTVDYRDPETGAAVWVHKEPQ